MDIKIKMPDDVRYIIQTIRAGGYAAYIVGGAVRDCIMKHTPKDWDICTSATPDEVINIFSDYKIIPTGLKHGTVTVMMNDAAYEITTFRAVLNGGVNRQKINNADLLADDLSCRDFTMNAMAYSDEEGLIDLYGGRRHIRLKTIECVGNPIERFEEDPLRILRAVRFASQYSFRIEASARHAMFPMAEQLKTVSAERVRDEFCKILMGNSFSSAVTDNYLILCKIIPECADMIGFEQKNPYHDFTVAEHTCRALKSCYRCDLIVKLTIFFHDIGKPHCWQVDKDGIMHFKKHAVKSAEIADKVMARLKFDNDTREKVLQLISCHDAELFLNEGNVKKWLNKLGAEQFYRLIQVRNADIRGQKKELDRNRILRIDMIRQLTDKVIAEAQCFSLKDLNIGGSDLISIGYKQGVEIGNVLRKLLQLVIDGEITNDKDVLLQKAREWHGE